ncbi:methyltransferase [Marinicauda salina]|uniref:Methyltransferase n=2 Tax=Marinicauda salina TaxID=2135793 RepID=A0A2U2BR98_9PROT|nr:methyltransferase [Marinicauda salina]
MSAAAAVLLAACGPQGEDQAPADDMDAAEADAAAATEDALAGGEDAGEAMDMTDAEEADALAAVLDHERRADDMARDQFRHPRETMEFFGLEPDMTIAEALPGGGWYTRILLPWVAEDGRYVALNYQMDLWEQMYGDNWTEETAAEMAAWPDTAPGELAENGPETAAPITAFMLDDIPYAQEGEADAVLFIRALHHLNRFDPAFLEEALDETYDFLRPGGIVGVVQHRAPEDQPHEMTTGDRGYMKQTDVVAAFEAAGFELEASSELNANPADAADHEQGVWGLPPTNAGDSEDEDVDPPQSTGESDRMTLLFRKPE